MINPLINPCQHIYRCKAYPKKCPNCKFRNQVDYFEPIEAYEDEEEDEEEE